MPPDANIDIITWLINHCSCMNVTRPPTPEPVLAPPSFAVCPPNVYAMDNVLFFFIALLTLLFANTVLSYMS